MNWWLELIRWCVDHQMMDVAGVIQMGVASVVIQTIVMVPQHWQKKL